MDSAKDFFQRDMARVFVVLVLELGFVQRVFPAVVDKRGILAHPAFFDDARRRDDLENAGGRKPGVDARVAGPVLPVVADHGEHLPAFRVHGDHADLPRIPRVHDLQQVFLQVHVETRIHQPFFRPRRDRQPFFYPGLERTVPSAICGHPSFPPQLFPPARIL